MDKELLTVFTPTYNRAYILHKLYESLKRQTYKSFVWLVVDDGSTDNTKELIEQWINESKITIKYIHQENGGKMRAWNSGVKNCNTELFFCVDSDDYIVDNCLETIKSEYKIFCKVKNTAGIVAYKSNDKGELLSLKFPEIAYSTLTDIYNYRFKGDTALIYKTEILKEYLFPELEGEKFITENYIYAQIDVKYKLYILPKVLVICEYQQDGYSKNQVKVMKNNPNGYVLYYNLKTKLEKSILKKIKYSIALAYIMFLGKIKHKLKRADNKVLFILSILPGYCVYLLRRRHAK